MFMVNWLWKEQGEIRTKEGGILKLFQGSNCLSAILKPLSKNEDGSTNYDFVNWFSDKRDAVEWFKVCKDEIDTIRLNKNNWDFKNLMEAITKAFDNAKIEIYGGANND